MPRCSRQNFRSDNFTVVGFDDIHYVATLGSYLMIPVQSEYLVAEVVGLREKDPTSGRLAQEHDGSELDKASSAKFLDLVPVGMLPQNRDGEFRFGVSTFPSLYADALYTLDAELDRIFEVAGWDEIVPPPDGNGSETRLRALTIGKSVVFEGYDIKVRVDEFFGGHVAVLGNTGSGKSCTVATILQSLFEKATERIARGATFVLFDVNGEYRRAFAELPQSIHRLYLRIAANPDEAAPAANTGSEETATFRLPHWFMSVEEWELLLRASERTQQPVLRTALGLSSLFSTQADQQLDALRNHILASCILFILQGDAGSPTKADRITGSFRNRLLNQVWQRRHRSDRQALRAIGPFPQSRRVTQEADIVILRDIGLSKASCGRNEGAVDWNRIAEMIEHRAVRVDRRRELLVARLGFRPAERDADANAVEAGAYAIIDAEEPAQIDVAVDLHLYLVQLYAELSGPVKREMEKHIGPVLGDAFPFAGRRCDRLTEKVLARLGLS